MAKYQPLEAHLRRAQHKSVHMTFAEIEKVIGTGATGIGFQTQGMVV